jgi:phage gpG-like protein
MPVNISFELSGGRQVETELNITIEKLRSFKPLFKKIGSDFRKTQNSLFAAEGAFEGNPVWAALSPQYAEQKEKKFPGRKILQATGKLRKSLTTLVGEGAINIITDDSIDIGTSIEYAGYHQSGTGKMPARPMFNITKLQEDRWINLIVQHIMKSGVDIE